MTRQVHIAVLTVGRSDFSILHPLVRDLCADPGFDVGLWVGGAHFDATSGDTAQDVRATGLPIWAELRATAFGAGPTTTIRAMAEQTAEVARVLDAGPRPDMVLILGDRFEAVAIGLALVPANIPVGHISGGSITEGAIDDVFRHCLTKIAAIHFCDVPDFARRIQTMGEDPARIFTVGALGLDGIARTTPAPLAEMADHFGFGADLRPGYVVATLHPETRAPDLTGAMAEAMIAALRADGRQVIFTYPNADPQSDVIIAAITRAAAETPDFHVVRNFGLRWFYTALHHAGMMVGNSSSGIIEAASFALPVVDIGDRQKGRYCGGNVIHCGITQAQIASALAQAASDGMAHRMTGFVNPYGDGQAARRIHAALGALDWGADLATKRFHAVDPGFAGAMAVLP